jgi:4-amino-4-deoxy-L-arabinose transferase-like glycosyltransferase
MKITYATTKNISIFYFLLWFLLLIVVLFSPDHFIYDEVMFAKNLLLFDHYGLTKNFLVEMQDQSPGPLYQLYHSALHSFTNYEPVLMRIANLIAFIATLLVLSIFLNSLSYKKHILISVTLLGLPLIWVIAGMALTEMPAILCISISIVLLYYSINGDKGKIFSCFLSSIAGIFLGLAIIGRTQYLVILVSALFLLLITQKRVIVLLFILFTLLVCTNVFAIWNGLVPPKEQNIYGGVNPFYGLLALGYLSIMHILLFKNWFLLKRNQFFILISISFLFSLVNEYFQFIQFEPLRGLVSGFGIPIISFAYKFGFIFIITLLSIFYIYSFLKEFFVRFDDKWFLFIHSSVFFVISTTMANSNQFSSRYVALSLPLMIIAYPDKIKIDHTLSIKSFIGASLGFISLLRYYQYI